MMRAVAIALCLLLTIPVAHGPSISQNPPAGPDRARDPGATLTVERGSGPLHEAAAEMVEEAGASGNHASAAGHNARCRESPEDEEPAPEIELADSRGLGCAQSSAKMEVEGKGTSPSAQKEDKTAGIALPDAHEGAGDGRLVVISNATNITLALGTFSTTLRYFPDPKTNIGTLQKGVPVDITGQLVDGNYTELGAGGAAAAMRNHGIANIVEMVYWEFNHEPQTPLALAWKNPDDINDTDINGTFVIQQWAPDVPKAGLYPMVFYFEGASVEIGGTIYNIYPPCRKEFLVAVQFPVELTVEVSPAAPEAGGNITITGTARGTDGVSLDNEGLLVSFAGTRIGAPLPAGWYIDDVTVVADTLRTVLKENFETGGTGWTHGGVGDDWMIGVPASPIGPTSANSGQRCAGTNLKGSYQQLADCVLVSPDFNLSMAFSAQLSFFEWYDLAREDSILVSLEALIGGLWLESDAIEVNGSRPQWTQRTIDFSEFTRGGGVFEAVGSERVHIKFRLVSRTFSVYTTGGEYSFRYRIPDETLPGEQNLTVTHPASLLYAHGSVSKVFPVKRPTTFVFPTNPAAHIAYRSSADGSIQKYIELRARLVDSRGDPPMMKIKDEKGEDIRQDYTVKVYWDATPLDPRDQPKLIGNARPLNMTENFWDGSLTIAYKVPNDQPLGPVYVIFSFGGTRYYSPGEATDSYTVMAHTFIEPPPPEERTVFRGSTVNLYGVLKVRPEESQFDTIRGDPVQLKNIRIFWAGEEQTKEGRTVITELDGTFSMSYHVSSTHALGLVPVSFKFDGDDRYQPCTADVNYSVKSQTFITLEPQVVMKGVPIDVYIDGVRRLGIAGVLRDDKGDRIGGVPVTLKRLRLGTEETLKSNLITGPDGVFVYPFTVRFEDPVGNLTLIATFAGDDKYTRSTNMTNYTVRVRTSIERIDTQTEVARGGTLNVQALLYEDWNGAPGYEIKYEMVTLSLDGQPLTNNMTDSGGQVSFRSIISSKTLVGMREISLRYNGSQYYLPTENTSMIFVQGRTLIEFQDVYPNETLQQKRRLSGRLRLVDDAYVPLVNQTVLVFFTIEKSSIDIENPEIEKEKRDKRIAVANTDIQGYISFNVTFRMGENLDTQQTWKLHLWAKYAGQTEVMPDGEVKMKYLNSTGTYSLTYIIPARVRVPEWGWLIVLVIIAVGSIITGWVLYEINKKRALRGMQTIIRRAADQLVAGNEYAAVIFKAYRKLAASMKRYGYMRRDSETFREFERAIRIALPIDQKAMNEFLTVLEEARYSHHEMGEPDRDRAINALRAVQYSLEKVILTQEQLAMIQDKAEALPEEAEPDIYIQSEEGLKKAEDIDIPLVEGTPVEPPEDRRPREPTTGGAGKPGSDGGGGTQ
ncbi:MAG: DUF4129 domain-containing protein [Thermoplasmata archaeon]